ncbi:hypothetical protein [Nostoc commune]|uniref:hypothetical protein n=1 Tax=Nostoc commune TaxID=1178 RepID=UPI0018C4F3D1|nr:hypothetical protein [Nostoc commune]MBG1263712.1 hypothetical protein [Nostoc commune BAE]
MENRLQIQDFQNDELYMELTPEELEELKELKGGLSLSQLSGSFTLGGAFPLGLPPFWFLNTTPNILVSGPRPEPWVTSVPNSLSQVAQSAAIAI